jgi:hypothetical protein
MSTKVAASDVQKNFGVWHDRALKEPVQVTKYGRETVYLVSAETFHGRGPILGRRDRIQHIRLARLRSEAHKNPSRSIIFERRYLPLRISPRKVL